MPFARIVRPFRVPTPVADNADRVRPTGAARLGFANARRGFFLAPCALAIGLALAGCDKCGDWFGQGSTKSCHDQSRVN
jgi:hypothetical protein